RVFAASPSPAAWQNLAERFCREDRDRQAAAKGYTPFADFRASSSGWQVGGQGLRGGPTRPGDFAPSSGGDPIVTAVLPAGLFTHAESDRLNGTLRSPIPPRGAKHISFRVMGRHGSAVRLVSNNCQLNYKNYRGLTSDELQWVTFALPEDIDSLR